MSPQYAAMGHVAALTVLVDQLTKQLIVQHFRVGEGFTVVPYLLRVQRAANKAGLFPAMSSLDAGERTLLLVALPLGLLACLAVALRNLHSPDAKLGAAISLVAGGAVGNLIDRLLRPAVVDFIQVRHQSFRLVFNLADVAIVTGVALVLATLAHRVWGQARNQRGSADGPSRAPFAGPPAV